MQYVGEVTCFSGTPCANNLTVISNVHEIFLGSNGFVENFHFESRFKV